MAEAQRFTITKPELTEAQATELEQFNAEKKYRYLKLATEDNLATLAALREKVKDIEGFWPWVLTSHSSIKAATTSSSDQEALSYLTDIELKQDPKDPRPFELVFHFKENPFFSNATLSKKYALPSEYPPIVDGKVTPETWEYDVDDLVATGTKIDWKSEDKNLNAKQPRQISGIAEDGLLEGDLGSFFWFFTEDGDEFGWGHAIEDEILPEVWEYFTGEAASDDEDEDDFDEDELDEEDEEDDEGSVDLEEEDEKPKAKKQKV